MHHLSIFFPVVALTPIITSLPSFEADSFDFLAADPPPLESMFGDPDPFRQRFPNTPFTPGGLTGCSTLRIFCCEKGTSNCVDINESCPAGREIRQCCFENGSIGQPSCQVTGESVGDPNSPTPLTDEDTLWDILLEFSVPKDSIGPISSVPFESGPSVPYEGNLFESDLFGSGPLESNLWDTDPWAQEIGLWDTDLSAQESDPWESFAYETDVYGSDAFEIVWQSYE